MSLTTDLSLNGVAPEPARVKMYILVNNDLGMGKGKIAGQVGHAVSRMVLYLAANGTKEQHELFSEWLGSSEAKIVKRCSEVELRTMAERYGGLPTTARIICGTIQDAGRTQVEPGALTALVFNPIPSDEVPEQVKRMKLL